MNKDPLIYLHHAYDALEKIVSKTQNLTYDQFMSEENEDLRFAIIKYIEIIGEAFYHVNLQFRQWYPDIPWQEAIDMRNFLVHDYFGIDTQYVWSTATKDLPLLLKQVKKILQDQEVI